MGTSAPSSSSSMGSGIGDFASDIGSGISDFASDVSNNVSNMFSDGPTEEQILSEGEPQRSDYETISDYEDAVEGFEMRLAEAKELDKEKSKTSEKLKKFSEATKGLGQNNQQVVRGSGPAGYGGPSARSSYVPAQSPYQITRRGPSTGELERMLLQGLKTSANMRISGFQGPRIRGLFG
jgi:uncharacterized protein YeeX (DUF496 family)